MVFFRNVFSAWIVKIKYFIDISWSSSLVLYMLYLKNKMSFLRKNVSAKLRLRQKINWKSEIGSLTCWEILLMMMGPLLLLGLALEVVEIQLLNHAHRPPQLLSIVQGEIFIKYYQTKCSKIKNIYDNWYYKWSCMYRWTILTYNLWFVSVNSLSTSHLDISVRYTSQSFYRKKFITFW